MSSRISVALALLFGAGLAALLGTQLTASSAASPGKDGAAQHGGRQNRLAGESSPYLLLHQYNPVDWYPWGEEALERARKEDKPIFLSVGYSTCYWCHVMERESFSSPEIAAYLNEHFIAIKVDREERPDLDEIYMTATQVYTGRGGWPNSVFLTPELVPFFAGTYFPPGGEQAAGGRPGFKELIENLHDAWQNRRDQVVNQSTRFREAMEKVLEERSEPTAKAPASQVAAAAAASLESRFDRTWGGFGGAPKFPSPANLFLFLDWLEERPEALEVLQTTFDRMARGGLYDQVGGGFHRYTVDEKWRVPHFEKMLYDNGLLLEAYARWHAATGDVEAARVARETVAFLEREMSAPEGGFWSAIDAETNAHEGAFYVWTRDELESVLGAEDASFLAPIYGFDKDPNFERTHYVLHLPATLEAQAERLDTSRQAILDRLNTLRQKLLTARGERERPLTDDKILTDWNGMVIAGLATAGRILDEPAYVARASRAADFLLTSLRPKDRPLQHSFRQGRAKIDAYLADYAFFVRGLLALHEASGEKRWLQAAVELADEQQRRLGDAVGGFFVAADQPDVIFRSKDIHDGAVPAANGVAVLNLLALHERTGEERFLKVADKALKAFGTPLQKSPAGPRTLALAALRFDRLGSSEPSSDAPPLAAGSALDELDALASGLVKAKLARGELEEGWRPLTVTLEVAEGWHLNANPASDDFLVPTELRGEVRNARYPAGKDLKLAFSEKPLSVYDGIVTLNAEGRDGAALSLRYQACDDERCLPPAVMELE